MLCSYAKQSLLIKWKQFPRMPKQTTPSSWKTVVAPTVQYVYWSVSLLTKIYWGHSIWIKASGKWSKRSYCMNEFRNKLGQPRVVESSRPPIHNWRQFNSLLSWGSMDNWENLESYGDQQRGSVTLAWPLFSPALLLHHTCDIWTLLDATITL